MSVHQEGVGLRGHAAGPGFFGGLKGFFFPARPSSASVLRTLVLFGVIGVLVGIAYLMVARPSYTTTMLIGPTQEQFASTPSSQLDRNALSMLSGGGLLSGPRVISPYDAFLQTLQTREVAQRLYDDLTMRKALFGDVWDDENKVWRDQFSLRAAIVEPLYWLTDRVYPKNPTVDTVEDILKNRVQLQMIERGPMYNLNYPAGNRATGMAFLLKLFQSADEIVKNKERRQVLNRIQFLKSRMLSLDVFDYRAQFAGLIMDQEKQLMILQGDTSFAASIIVAPNAPLFPDSPRLFVTIVLSAVLFFLLGASILALHYRDLIAGRMRRSQAAEDAQ